MSHFFQYKYIAAVFAVLFFSIASIQIHVVAATPQTISYQGTLRSAVGVPVVGQYDFIVRYYTTQIGGGSVYQEQFSNTTVHNGSFFLSFGAGSVQSGSFAALDFNQPIFITFETKDVTSSVFDGEMVPRIPFQSVPYARNSSLLQGKTIGGASGVVGYDALGGISTINLSAAGLIFSGATNLPITLVTGYLNPNALNYADNSIQVLSNGIAVNIDAIRGLETTATGVGLTTTCTTGQILQWSGTAWNCALITDSQTLSIAANTLTISNGNSVTLPSDSDGIIGNEVFDISAGVGIGLTGTKSAGYTIINQGVLSATSINGITNTGTSVDPVFGLLATGVTAGTYNNVTVDGFGRVITAANSTVNTTNSLSFSDITNSLTSSVNGVVATTSLVGFVSPITVQNVSSLFSTGLPSPAGLGSFAAGSNFFGLSAGNAAMNALDSNFFGTDAGNGAENANSSNFFGNAVGVNAVNASNSNFFGYAAGSNASDARFSNFFGYAAGNNASEARFSNFFGYAAGSNASEAQYSNFFGYSAGNNASEARFSNFFGYAAGNNSTNAGNSNFFGYAAGSDATNAGYSNFFGYTAGNNAKEARFSNFFGFGAGSNATNANDSNFFGYSAGANASEARYANFVGFGAGSNAFNANNSNFLGSYAGEAAYNANNSIFIGNHSGAGDSVNNSLNVGDTSILIGDNTSTGGNSNSIALGSGAINSYPNQFLVGRNYTDFNFRGLNYVFPSVQGGLGSVLTNDGTGMLEWTTSTNINGPVTASNGLTAAGVNIQLGGNLTQDTLIDGNGGSYDFTVQDLRSFSIDGGGIGSVGNVGNTILNLTGSDAINLTANAITLTNAPFNTRVGTKFLTRNTTSGLVEQMDLALFASPITAHNGSTLLSSGISFIPTTNAQNSVFLGYAAGHNADNSNYSNFIGAYAGYGNQSNSGIATNATNSNFFGSFAGYGAANANNSIFIGNSTGYDDAVNNAGTGIFAPASILIGNFANTGGFSDSIVLGNQGVNTASNQLLIPSSYNKLTIGGVDYVVPSYLGAPGSVLTTDASGTLSWTDVGVGPITIQNTANLVSSGIGAGVGAFATNAIMLGNSAGYSASDATRAILIGAAAGANTNNINSSTFVGSNSGTSAMDAYNSNFYGLASGSNATRAHQSNFFGAFAGADATNAANSIFIGNHAGLSDTVNNYLSGTSILIGNSTSTGGFSNSIALGANARNTAANQFKIAPSYTGLSLGGVDYVVPSSQGSAGQVLTNNGSGLLTWTTPISGAGCVPTGSGIFNVCLGQSALQSNTTGTNNTAIGSFSLANVASGFNNVAVGTSSLKSYSLSNATAIGASALESNTTGYANTALGAFAGLETTTGGYNTMIGTAALQSNISGQYNTALGIRAGQTTTGSYNISIGADSDVPVATNSNQLSIGNIIFGTGIGGTVASPTGNIGIGEVAPSTRLQITSDTANTSGLKFTNLTTASPTSTGQAIGVDASGNLVTVAGVSNAWSILGNAGTDGGLTNFIGTTDAQDFVLKTNSTEKMRVGTTGTISVLGLVDTLAPGAPLTLSPKARLTSGGGGQALLQGGAAGPTGTGGLTRLVGGTGGSTSGNGGNINLIGGAATEGNGGSISFSPNNGSSLSGTARNGGGLTMQAGSAVFGGIAGRISIQAGSGQSSDGGITQIFGGQGSAGFAGGNTSIRSGVSIDGNGGNLVIASGRGTGPLGNAGDLILGGGSVASGGVFGSTIFVSGLTNDTTFTERMRLLPDGNFGVGTATPTARLEIASGLSNISGFKFSNFSSASPTATGQPIGVDASGNVVRIAAGGGTLNNAYNFGGAGVGNLINLTSGSGVSLLGVQNNYLPQFTVGNGNEQLTFTSHDGDRASGLQVSGRGDSSLAIQGGATASLNFNGGVGAGDGSISASNRLDVYSSNTRFNGTNFGIYSGSTPKFTVNSSGSVSIGALPPTLKLSVTDNATTNVAVFNGLGSTQCTVVTGTGLSCSSDVRLKKNVASLDPALSLINQLRPVTYQWKDGTLDTQSGFIAQEVEVVIPGLVSTNSDGFKSLNITGIMPYVVKALQEQSAQITAINARLDALVLPQSSAVIAVGPSLTDAQKTILESFEVTPAALVLTKNLTVKGEIIAQNINTANLQTKGIISVSNRTAGTVEIVPDTTEFEVVFVTPYNTQPIVLLTVQENAELNAVVSKSTVNGFTIKLDKPQATKTLINWFAVQTK